MFKKPLFLLYIMFSFLGIDLFVFEAKARSQNLHSLSNSELSDFVSTYESDIQGQIHSCFWAIPNSRTRLGVRLLPRCILDEERSGNGIAFDRWCAEQMRIGRHDIKTLIQTLMRIGSIEETHADSLLVLGSFLTKLPFDIDQSRGVRAAAILACSTNDDMEFREILCLLVLLFSLGEELNTAEHIGFQALLNYLETDMRTAIMSVHPALPWVQV